MPHMANLPWTYIYMTSLLLLLMLISHKNNLTFMTSMNNIKKNYLNKKWMW